MCTTVFFKKLTHDAKPFQYTRENDACMDVYSNEEKILKPNERAIIKTGITIEIPNGFEGQIRGRSGLSSNGLLVHLGTIESEYRGEVGVIITNLYEGDFKIDKHMRIAQFTIKPVFKINLEEKSTLSETSRGDNGYGSSGNY